MMYGSVHCACDSLRINIIIALLGRLQSVDWTGGLDWWTDTKNLSNDTHLPVGLCGSPAALFLATYMVVSCHYTILYILY